MSRSIYIGYRHEPHGEETKIELRPPYYLFGFQRRSLAFWSQPKLKEAGIERLTILGEAAPISFSGWDDMAVLGRELAILHNVITRTLTPPGWSRAASGPR